MKHIAVLCVALSLAAGGAQAQSSWPFSGDSGPFSGRPGDKRDYGADGFRIGGTLGWVDTPFSSESVFVGQLRYRQRLLSSVSSSWPGFGIDLGLGVKATEADTRLNYDAALLYGDQRWRVEAGLPRPAIDRVLRGYEFGNSPILTALYFADLRGSILRDIQRGSERPTWGIAYVWDAEPLKLGASYHYLSEREETGYTLGASYDFGNVKLGMGIEGGEYLSDVHIVRTTVSGRFTDDWYYRGVHYTYEPFGNRVHVFGLATGVTLGDRVELGIDWARRDLGVFDQNVFGLNAGYRINDWATLRGGVTDFDGDHVLSIEIETDYRVE